MTAWIVAAFIVGCWVGALMMGALARSQRDEVMHVPARKPGRKVLPDVQPRVVAPYKIERGHLAIDPVIFDRSRFEPGPAKRISDFGRMIQWEQWQESTHRHTVKPDGDPAC